MRIEKFERKHLISGRSRALARRVVLSALAPIEWAERVLGRRRRYLIILGHMRAGSSLLTNVVAASSEACGYGETFTRYSSRFSFRLLLARVRLQRLRHGRLTVPGEIVIDKALHNGLTPSAEALSHPDARFIFLLRDGERSVKSMVHEFEVSEQVATDYYVERLDHLVELAGRLRELNRPFTLVTFEELTSDRERTLDRLTRFIGLREPLSHRFEAAPGSSRPGAGDPSGRVHAGEVLQAERPLEVEVSRESLERAAAAYERTRRLLREMHEARAGAA